MKHILFHILCIFLICCIIVPLQYFVHNIGLTISVTVLLTLLHLIAYYNIRAKTSYKKIYDVEVFMENPTAIKLSHVQVLNNTEKDFSVV